MVTITYTNEPNGSILAELIDDKGVHLWPGGHYLGPDEAALLKTDPAALDSKLVLNIPVPQAPAAPVVLPPAVQLRQVAVDPAGAVAVVQQFETDSKQLNDGLQDLLTKAAALPIEKRIAILAQAHAALLAALPPV